MNDDALRKKGLELMELHKKLKVFQWKAAHEKSFIKRRKLELKAGRALAKAHQLARMLKGEANAQKEG